MRRLLQDASVHRLIIVFKFCAQNLWHFEDIPIKYRKQFCYYI